jgi:hypothetical protein
MERQVGHGATARRLWQKIDKRLACRFQSIVYPAFRRGTARSLSSGSTTLSDGDGQEERARSRRSVRLTALQ